MTTQFAYQKGVPATAPPSCKKSRLGVSSGRQLFQYVRSRGRACAPAKPVRPSKLLTEGREPWSSRNHRPGWLTCQGSDLASFGNWGMRLGCGGVEGFVALNGHADATNIAKERARVLQFLPMGYLESSKPERTRPASTDFSRQRRRATWNQGL